MVSRLHNLPDGAGDSTIARLAPPANPARLPLTSRSLHYGRVRRGGTFLALLILAVGAIGYRHLTHAPRIRAQAENYLAQFVSGRVQVDAAEFSFFRGIHLIGVSVSEPLGHSDASDPERPPLVFHCDHLLLKHNPLQMLLGRLRVDEIVAVRPACTIIQTVESGRLNIEGLFLPPTTSEPGGPMRLPVVRLKDASFQVVRRRASQIRSVETIRVQLLGEPDGETPSLYRVAWNGGGEHPSSGVTLVDLRTLALVDAGGGIPWSALEAAMVTLAPHVPGAVAYCDMLGLTGEVRAQHYKLSAGMPAGGKMGTIQLRNGAMSIPVDAEERSLPIDQRFLRFQNVEGSLDFFAGRVAGSLVGSLGKSPVRIDVELSGPAEQGGLANVGFDITFSGTDLTLPRNDSIEAPAEARFVQHWQKIRDLYRDFDPHGRVSLEFSVFKSPGEDEPVQVRYGRLNALGCDAAYRFFPYRVSEITGMVEFSPEGVFLRDLSGNHAGAPITVKGWISEPRWHAAVKLDMTGEGVPLDADLHDAMNPRYQAIWDRFALGGAADITVHMERREGAPGHTEPWSTTIAAELRDADVCFTGFPYPIRQVTGRVDVVPQGIRGTALKGRAGSGSVSADGFAHLPGGALVDLQLTLEARQTAFDDSLLAALTPQARSLVESLNPQGTFDLSGRIGFCPEARRIEYDLEARVHDAAANYRDVPVPLSNLTGSIHLKPNRIQISELTGRYGSTTVSVAGTHESGDDASQTSLTIRCRDLAMDDALKAKLPAQVAESLKSVDIRGVVHTSTLLERSTKEGRVTSWQRTDVELPGVDLCHAAFPFWFTEVTGRVVAAGNRLTFESLTARHNDTVLSLRGEFVREGNRTTGSASLRADDLALDEDLRQAVPWRLRKLWNDVRPTGTVDVDIPDIRYDRIDLSPPRWSLDGTVQLHDVGLEVGAVVTDAVGRLRGRADWQSGNTAPDFTGDLELQTVAVQDRVLNDVTGRFGYDANTGSMSLPDLRGRTYGGSATGTVETLREGPGTTYNATALLVDVALSDFLSAGRPPDAPALDAAGILNARLYLSGTTGELESRRGGGRVHVQNGRFFRMPLPHAIAQVLGLGDFDDSAFHDLSAEFFLQGSRMQIKDFIVQGNSLAMMGSGSLETPDKTIDLTLISTGPQAWGRVPVLSELLEGTSRELMEVRVRGPLGQPTIEAVPFRGVSQGLETLIQPRPPRAVQPDRPLDPRP